MADRLRQMGRRLSELGAGLVNALVRDNRVLPPVLAVLALFVIAWILAGAFEGQTDQKPVAHRSDLAQSGNSGGNPPSSGVENRDVNSYAAYRSKDPFRQLLAPEETTTGQSASTPPEQTTPESTTGTGRTPGRPGAGSARDTDGDGIPDRRERRLGTNPNNPDTDGDGIPDGSDKDANGDGRPDTGVPGAGSGGTGTGATPGSGAAPGTGTAGRGGARQGGGLLNSGGTLPPP